MSSAVSAGRSSPVAAAASSRAVRNSSARHSQSPSRPRLSGRLLSSFHSQMRRCCSSELHRCRSPAHRPSDIPAEAEAAGAGAGAAGAAAGLRARYASLRVTVSALNDVYCCDAKI